MGKTKGSVCLLASKMATLRRWKKEATVFDSRTDVSCVIVVTYIIDIPDPDQKHNENNKKHSAGY